MNYRDEDDLLDDAYESSAEFIEDLDYEDQRDTLLDMGEDVGQEVAKFLEYDTVKELSAGARRDMDRDFERIVNPVLRKKYFDR